jgi:hypothetical protein
MEAPFSICRGQCDYTAGTPPYLTETDWNTRVNPNYFGCWGNSYEATIAFCNLSKTDMWVIVPVNATKNWMQNFAQLVHNTLDPSVHVYIEYVDEAWNWDYDYWSIIYAASQANPALDNIGGARQPEQVAFKLMELYSAMHPILGSQARFVLMGQLVNVGGTCAPGLKWIAEHYGPPSNYIYGIGGAAYVGPSSSVPYTETIGNTTSLFASMNAYLNGTIIPCLQQYRALANEYNLKLVCYEGGQGLTCNSTGSDFAFMMSAETDPAMETLYANLGAALESTGVDEMNFTDDCSSWGWTFGLWGNVVDVRQANSSSPRFTACVNLAKNGAQSPARTPPPPAKPAKHH